METVKLEMMLPKEAAELGMALGKLVVEIKKALSNGLDVDDIAPIMAALMSAEVVAGVQGIENMPAELKADQSGFVMAIGCGFSKSYKGM